MLTFSINTHFEDLASTSWLKSWIPKSNHGKENWSEMIIDAVDEDKEILNPDSYSMGMTLNRLKKTSKDIPLDEVNLIDTQAALEFEVILDQDEARTDTNALYDLLSESHEWGCDLLQNLMLIYIGAVKPLSVVISGADVTLAKELKIKLGSNVTEKAAIAEEYEESFCALKIMESEAKKRYALALNNAVYGAKKVAKYNYEQELAEIKEFQSNLKSWYADEKSERSISWSDYVKLTVHKSDIADQLKESLNNRYIWSTLLKRWLEYNPSYQEYLVG
jgi:hypothetical protein